MTAIFKRELKSYLTSMVGYLFIFCPGADWNLFFRISALSRLFKI